MSRFEALVRRLLAEAEAARSAAVGRDPALAGLSSAELVAIGLATVDWERAARASGAGEWEPLPRDSLLGATVRRARASAAPSVLLLEPDTEGPLAASLARFGEGLAAVYLRTPAGGRARTRPGRFARAGPLGPARLLPGPAWGPHVVALEPAATIKP
ncbi:MAG: hypothetical protein FIA92_02820 [Chloroflexi bacterium]|nr:hypothetical protein [Chloroflexota bacterium]